MEVTDQCQFRPICIRFASLLKILRFSSTPMLGQRPISEAVRPRPTHQRLVRCNLHSPVQGDSTSSTEDTNADPCWLAYRRRWNFI